MWAGFCFVLLKVTCSPSGPRSGLVGHLLLPHKPSPPLCYLNLFFCNIKILLGSKHLHMDRKSAWTTSHLQKNETAISAVCQVRWWGSSITQMVSLADKVETLIKWSNHVRTLQGTTGCPSTTFYIWLLTNRLGPWLDTSLEVLWWFNGLGQKSPVSADDDGYCRIYKNRERYGIQTYKSSKLPLHLSMESKKNATDTCLP